MNKRSHTFAPEVRERAVRMVQEHRADYPSLWAAVQSIAPKIPPAEAEANYWQQLESNLESAACT